MCEKRLSGTLRNQQISSTCKVGQKLGSVSPSVDMLPFGVTIPATVPQGSEIPEGLTNNPLLTSVACRALPYFPALSHKGTIFGKYDIERKVCVLILLATFVCKISHSNKNPALYHRKCMLVFMYSTLYSCEVLMELEYPREVFDKFSNIKFLVSPYSGCRVVPWGRTVGQT